MRNLKGLLLWNGPWDTPFPPHRNSATNLSLPRSSAPKELLVMMRGGTTKEPPLQTDASFFWMTCAHVFLGGSSTGGLWAHRGRSVQTSKPSQVLEEALETHTDITAVNPIENRLIDLNRRFSIVLGLDLDFDCLGPKIELIECCSRSLRYTCKCACI
jgi:hypothetical protein